MSVENIMKKRKICAVVATYNRKQHVQKCIKNILNQKDCECDIIVVDNGSEDGTDKIFATEIELDNLYYFNTGKNLGSAGAQAIGIKEAVQRGYEYIWLMDDDVFPNEDALFELVKADKELKGNWGILSSVAYWTDGKICEANRQKKTLFKFMSKNDYNKRFVKAYMVSAASMYIKADAVKKVGLPIAEYFFYTDDYEFSSRIAKMFPVYVVPASKVTHAMRVNMKADLAKDTLDRLYRYEHLYRNDVHCYRHLGVFGYIYLLVKFLYTFFKILVGKTLNKKIKCNVLIKGYLDGIKFNPNIEFP